MRYQTILKVFTWLLTFLFLAEGKEFFNWTSSEITMDKKTVLNNSVRYLTIEDNSKRINKILNLSSVWDCDKYSSAVEVITKRAIALAEEVSIYLLQSSKKDENDKKFYQQLSIIKKIKINLLNRGIDFYKDFLPILKIICQDTINALTLIGKMISDDLQLHISGLTISIN